MYSQDKLNDKLDDLFVRDLAQKEDLLKQLLMLLLLDIECSESSLGPLASTAVNAVSDTVTNFITTRGSDENNSILCSDSILWGSLEQDAFRKCRSSGHSAPCLIQSCQPHQPVIKAQSHVDLNSFKASFKDCIASKSEHSADAFLHDFANALVPGSLVSEPLRTGASD
ncbi:unnamed protein product, partial [Protopolystoma xenopodis]